MSSGISFNKTSGILEYLPLSGIFLMFSNEQKQEERQQLHWKDNPMRLLSCPPLETTPTLNTKCFGFVFPPIVALFPPQRTQRRQHCFWASDSKKILGPQCIHSSLDSFTLGSVFVRLRGPWDSLKETFSSLAAGPFSLASQSISRLEQLFLSLSLFKNKKLLL